MTEIDAALQRQDGVLVGTLGHRIKSTASAVGATGLADLGRLLEATRASGDLDLARQLAARLPACVEGIKLLIHVHYAR